MLNITKKEGKFVVGGNWFIKYCFCIYLDQIICFGGQFMHMNRQTRSTRRAYDYVLFEFTKPIPYE